MKKGSLAEALQQSAKQRQEQPAAPATPKTRIRSEQAEQATDEKPKTKAARSREGKSFVGGWFTPEVSRAVNILALKQNTTQQGLVEEGLRAMFEKFGEKWPD